MKHRLGMFPLVAMTLMMGCSIHKPEMHSTDPDLMLPKPNVQDSFDYGKPQSPESIKDQDICASMEDQSAMLTCYMNKLAPPQPQSFIGPEWFIPAPIPKDNPKPKLTMRPI